MTKYNSVPTDKIRSVLTPEENAKIPFVFSASRLKEMRESLCCGENELLLGLAQLIRPFAITPLSHFNVGVVVLGITGTAYLGVNIEFEGIPLSQTVHAEQCATSNAWHHHEEQIVLVAGTEEPCGHCRQFLAELPHSDKLHFVVDGREEVLLTNILVNPFLPTSIKIEIEKETPLTSKIDVKPEFDLSELSAQPQTKQLATLALEALERSYSPYQISQCSPAALALRLKGGIVSAGALIENVAFNPSLPPLQSALIRLVVIEHNQKWGDIEEVVIVEDPKALIHQKEVTEAVIKVLSPSAKFMYLPVSVPHHP
ncbi:Cytidine deaminase [Monocercomonoides exilis]|uniref:Cytidine deaminase n=1 Tax=Monocercomonoides exilis TaxID=2049356 RepID=UPI003559AE94|nr:Cytidine deaminase [Monocercomonoides exilis]|eukprot:MONOS_2203.1-p1 / transcript=MONOS_2203.1 / gene=MONOS_2203 / organism=Monocercomonoides_exilis_PA203 / gene_product=Cytidine deaminase [EC:3.5.4.5] / transcript_product=Cytidine deaminase [EC:3.5.4.5] / location=Mono_scaffold00043:182023-183515(+) / protein_length=314 / sequence_SO=supercontig / SO=protein_coding / is_pseudo=false